MASRAASRTLIDRDEIRQWAEERGATPACVRGTGGGEDTGMIRLDFPGYTGAQSLEPIEWDDWFEKFEESRLALLVQDETARGERSNFNKLIGRESGQERAEPGNHRRSRGHRSTARGSRSSRSKQRSAGRSSSRKKSSRTSRTSSSSSSRHSSGNRRSTRSARATSTRAKRAGNPRSRAKSTSSRNRATARRNASTRARSTANKSTARSTSRRRNTTSSRSRGKVISIREHSSRGRSNSRSTGNGSRRSAASHVLTNHNEIRRWAEERDASPASVRKTGGKRDVGMIRLDFPGYSGAQSLEHINWNDWFRKFDESNLGLLVQDKTARGQKSNFNKLVSRESGGGRRSASPRSPGSRKRAA